MSLSIASFYSEAVVVVKALLTWGSAAMLALGAVLHKLWSKLLGAEAKLMAEVAKLTAEAANKL